MKVLVTGAGGFSGAELVKALLARGHHVTALVGSSRGRLSPDAGPVERLEVRAGDLVRAELPKALDAIVHAAARSPGPGVDVARMVHDNVLATQHLVAHAKSAGVRSFVFFSSLSVHGRIEAATVEPETPVIDPDPYGLTKRLCEEMLAAEAGSFRSLSIRLPGIVGPDSVRNWLTGVLAVAKAGGEIPIYNPDAAYNNAVHVSDLVEFACGLLEREWGGADAVPIGAAGQTTVMKAAKLLIDAFGGRASLRIEPSRKPAFTISSAHACERYGYRPMQILKTLDRFAAENGAATQPAS